MKMNPVVHFEMPAEDKKRMVDFYTKTFGWHAQMMGPEMGEYVVVSTTETDEKTNLPKSPGAINGGFFTKVDEKQSPSIVIAVDDIHEAMKKVTASGGKVPDGQKPGEPDDIPGVGLYVSFIDTEGNTDWVEDTIKQAIDCLKNDSLPEAGADCDFCAYRKSATKAESGV